MFFRTTANINANRPFITLAIVSKKLSLNKDPKRTTPNRPEDKFINKSDKLKITFLFLTTLLFKRRKIKSMDYKLENDKVRPPQRQEVFARQLFCSVYLLGNLFL